MTNYAAFKFECDQKNCDRRLGDVGFFLFDHPNEVNGKENKLCWCFCLKHKKEGLDPKEIELNE